MLPITGSGKIKTRQMTGKNELERSFKSLSKLMSKNTTISQAVVLNTRSSVEAATSIYDSSKDLLGRSLAQQDTNNKILQEIIRTLQEKDDDDLNIPKGKKRSTAGKRTPQTVVRPGRTTSAAKSTRPPRVEPTLPTTPTQPGSTTAAAKPSRARIEPRLPVPARTEQATRTKAPSPTATQQQSPRPGRIAVGGGLEFDTATNRFHDPRLPGNRNMVKNADALSRGAVRPTPAQIQEAQAARAASRVPTPVTPPPPPIAASPPPAVLRADPAERLVPSTPTTPPPAASEGPGRLQRADEALGRALESPRGRVAAGGLTVVFALPMIIDAYNEISALPTTMPRNEYEQRVTTIILQLITAGIALPYLGAVIGGLIGTAIFPGIGTIAGLGAGVVGGAVASYTADEMVRELTSKLVAHFYDRASRQDSDGVHINYYNQYLAQQRALPQNQRGLPDDIEELQKLLMAATVTARSGGTALRPVAAATANSIRQKIQMLREAEQQGARQVSSLEAADASLLTLARNDANEGPSKADTADAFAAMDRSEYRNLTFEASTIIFDGDIAQEQASSATRMSASSALATPAAASATVSGGGAIATPVGTSNMLQQSSSAAGGAIASDSGMFSTLRTQESGTNDTARNPNSSATGRYQFINETWLQFASENSNLFGNMNQQQILAARDNPQLQEVAVRWYANRNATSLSRAGVPVNDTTIALSHFLGVGGAISVLRADPNTPLDQILSSSAIAANASVLSGKTAGQLLTLYSQRYGVGSTFSGTGQRVSSTPQTGSAMAESSTATEAERMRRLAQSSLAIIQQTGAEQGSNRSSITSGQTATSTEDVTLNFRLRQAVA